MSHPSDSELERLGMVAEELFETFSERGHHVPEALAVDAAFGSGRSRSALSSDLVHDVVKRVGSQLGLNPVRESGALELRVYDENFNERRYRVLKVLRRASGELRMRVNSESTLCRPRWVEDEGLTSVAIWILGWIPAEGSDQLEEVVIAELLDVAFERDGSAGDAVFGRIISLGNPVGPAPRFIPVFDDELPGLEERETRLGRDTETS